MIVLIAAGLALFLLIAYRFVPGAVTVVRAAQVAGFQGDDLVIAVAVAYAESGGDVNAYNPEVAAGTPTGEGSYGLWQIYLHDHPEFKDWNLYDPQQNALAAFRIYSAAGNSFSPWSTFKSGAYQAQINRAQSEVGA